MAPQSRWKEGHAKWPSHSVKATNSDGTVHQGYHLLEFQAAQDLIRIGPYHSPDDYFGPGDFQLLLLVSEYVSALLEYLDWFWPDFGWEEHRQALILSKRLLQPSSPHHYLHVQVDPRVQRAWTSFTYSFFHGTRHAATLPAGGDGDMPADHAVLNDAAAEAQQSARTWLNKLVGEHGFTPDGAIMPPLRTWLTGMRPRLQEEFPAVAWDRPLQAAWNDHESAVRVCEKRGAIKRQQEEDYPIRFPLRVTAGRPKFNHLKVEARDGFTVAIPSIKNPPALAFIPVADVMCAFKQAAELWPPASPGQALYRQQQDVVQSFIMHVLRGVEGSLSGGEDHAQYRYLAYLGACVLGWERVAAAVDGWVSTTASWGPLPLLVPGMLATGILLPLPVAAPVPRLPPQQAAEPLVVDLRPAAALQPQQAQAAVPAQVPPASSAAATSQPWQATRTRASPFGQPAARSAQAAPMAAPPPPPAAAPAPEPAGAEAGAVPRAVDPTAMSIGGLSSMQDLLGSLPSFSTMKDASWSLMLNGGASLQQLQPPSGLQAQMPNRGNADQHDVQLVPAQARQGDAQQQPTGGAAVPLLQPLAAFVPVDVKPPTPGGPALGAAAGPFFAATITTANHASPQQPAIATAPGHPFRPDSAPPPLPPQLGGLLTMTSAPLPTTPPPAWGSPPDTPWRPSFGHVITAVGHPAPLVIGQGCVAYLSPLGAPGGTPLAGMMRPLGRMSLPGIMGGNMPQPVTSWSSLPLAATPGGIAPTTLHPLPFVSGAPAGPSPASAEAVASAVGATANAVEGSPSLGSARVASLSAGLAEQEAIGLGGIVRGRSEAHAAAVETERPAAKRAHAPAAL